MILYIVYSLVPRPSRSHINIILYAKYFTSPKSGKFLMHVIMFACEREGLGTRLQMDTCNYLQILMTIYLYME